MIDTGFVLNSAGGAGGAIVNNSAGWLDVTGSLFQDNSANTGGAIYNDNASSQGVRHRHL